MNYTKIECECIVKVFNDPENQYDIVYCSLHKSAKDMYEALKKMRKFYETVDMDFQVVKQDILNVLAEAEGRTEEVKK